MAQAVGVPIIVNISGNSYEEFSELGAIFGRRGVSAGSERLVPMWHRGISFGMDARSCYRATQSVRKTWKAPHSKKPSPDNSP